MTTTTGGVRCHNPDACCAGQKPCPSPGACGVAAPVGTTDLAAAVTSSRDAYFGHRGHLQRTPASDRLFADAFTLGADFALDAGAGAQPAATVYTMEALVPGGGIKHHAQMHVALPAGTKLYASPQPNAALADGWMPIETAPENELLLVGWVDPDDTLDRHCFDLLEDGCWQSHEEDREHYLMVAPPGSRGPGEKPPYTHWKRIGSLPAPPTLNASKEAGNG